MSSNEKTRDFTKPIPEDHICPLCNLDNKDCECIKHNCKCNIIALECKWPDCVCYDCLQIIDVCRCKNE